MIDESAVNRTGRLEFTIYAAGDRYLKFIRKILKKMKILIFKLRQDQCWELVLRFDESGEFNPMDSLKIQNGMIQKILLMVDNFPHYYNY